MTVINIGVPSDHPLADTSSRAGPSGLHNVQIGGVPVPAPQFVMMHRAQPENGQGDASNAQNPLSTTDNETRVGQNIENMVNNLLRSFMDLFNQREFLRMQMQYSQFNPNDFMNNYNQSFASDHIFEQIRRLSEEEAQRRQRAKKAKKEAVDRLPVIQIEEKHCKKKGNMLEAPTCTVCCHGIELSTKGMFMPCGHIYHPDCLKPWLE